MTEPAAIPSATTAMRYYVNSAVLLCLMTLLAIVLVTIFAPENTTAVPLLIGVSGSLTGALLAQGIKGMGVSMDGKMERLLDETAQKERLKGLLAGLRENPATNLDPSIPPDTGERRGKPLDTP